MALPEELVSSVQGVFETFINAIKDALTKFLATVAEIFGDALGLSEGDE